MEQMSEIKSHGRESVKLGETVDGEEDGSGTHVDCQFLLFNPKNLDSVTQSLLKEITSLYMKELPGMNYAANTGKQSSFLQRCVLSGKFCTLLLSEKSEEMSLQEHEPIYNKYMQLYKDPRERLYQDEGYSTMLDVDRANYDSLD